MRNTLKLPILLFALILPTCITFPYFVWFNDSSPQITQSLYALGKIIQFSLPVVWILFLAQEKIRFAHVKIDNNFWKSVSFGVLATLLGIGLFQLMQLDTSLIESLREKVQGKINTFGLHSLQTYILFAIFVSIIHSFLEEYYWRWFVFRKLQTFFSPITSTLLSSIGFSLHHIIILSAYFGLYSIYTTLFTLCLIVGGAVWCLLYSERHHLYNVWISHAIVDIGIFIIGYQLLYSSTS